MTNKEFDALLRASAQREVFRLTEHMEDNIKRTIEKNSTAKRIRRFTARTALVAALIVLLLAATALAVSNLPGVVELMERIGWGASDERMEHIQQQTAQPQGQTYELPDVAITLSEVVYDGNRLYAAVHVAPKAEHNVVLVAFDSSPSGYYGANEAAGDVIPEGAKTNAEVAKERGAKLLMADVFVDALRAGDDSTGMDFTTNPDGSYDFVFELEGVTADESGSIPVELFGCQVELTDEGVQTEGTWTENRWTIPIPALVEPFATAAPAPAEPPAAAQQTDVLRVLGNKYTLLPETYQAAYPDRQLVFVEATEQITPADWDVCLLSTDDALYQQLVQSAAAYDLSGSDELAAWASRLYAPVRQAVTQNGALYAVPIDLGASMNGDYLFTRELRFAELNAWKQAGFTDEDMPETADELFALIGKYAALPKEVRKDINLNYQAEHARSWLLGLMMDLYVAQSDGAPQTFQSDELHALLDRMDQAADLLKGEKEIGYSVLEDSGLLQGAERAVALRLFESSPRRVYANMRLLAVNPESPCREQAVEFAEAMVDALDWEELAKLDAQITFDELNELALKQAIASTERTAAWYQERADKAPDEISRKEAQENADAQLESIEYIKQRAASEGVIPALNLTYPEDLQAYRQNLAPALSFGSATLYSVITDGEAYAALEKRYLSGKIDTDAFLKELDGLLP